MTGHVVPLAWRPFAGGGWRLALRQSVVVGADDRRGGRWKTQKKIFLRRKAEFELFMLEDGTGTLGQ